MKKITYKVIAKQPIFTGSDEDAGIMKTLRREKVALLNPVKHQSWFKSENSRRVAVLMILEEIWRKIDFEDMKGNRRLRIWDEFSSKLLAATRVRTRFQFLNELARMFNIKSLSNPKISDIIQRFSDDEFLNLIREEQQFLVLLLRNKRQAIKEDIQDFNYFPEDKELKSEFDVKNYGRDVKEQAESLYFSKTFERIPYVSGNSIRGILRRLAMRDFCEQVGIKKLHKDIYHQLFTGGSLSDSTMFEDIEKREEYIKMCPMIGLFGSAIGNMTIEGELKIGALRPVCKEHGDGEASFWELLGTEFGVRSDSAKTERDIEIVANDDSKPQQMKYEYEVFIKGTELSGQLICSTYDELIESAFWHVLQLFKHNPFVGGQSSVGNGELDLQYETSTEKTKLYLDYLKNNQEKIREYFNKS
jgi:hypothetical protein